MAISAGQKIWTPASAFEGIVMVQCTQALLEIGEPDVSQLAGDEAFNCFGLAAEASDHLEPDFCFSRLAFIAALAFAIDHAFVSWLPLRSRAASRERPRTCN